jgi:tetratricopeptide (TPR) repeat protein
VLTGLASYRLSALAAYAEARQLCERALAIRERVLGPEHPDTAASVSLLGGVLWAQVDYAGARPLVERALAIRERGLGPDDPRTAANINNLALLLHEQGELTSARKFF